MPFVIGLLIVKEPLEGRAVRCELRRRRTCPPAPLLGRRGWWWSSSEGSYKVSKADKSGRTWLKHVGWQGVPGLVRARPGGDPRPAGGRPGGEL